MESLPVIMFWILAILTGFSAVATVVTQNIVRCATFLLFALAGTSGVFFLLGADLVAAIQLLVYVGGTLVLVVFGVMLTAQGPFINMKASSAEWAISSVVGLTLLGVLAFTIVSGIRYETPLDSTAAVYAPYKTQLKHIEEEIEEARTQVVVEGEVTPEGKVEIENEKVSKGPPVNPAAASRYSATIGQGFLGVGVGPAHNNWGVGVNHEQRGKAVRMHYLLPFEIVSVHLLVVLIGAAYLARAKRRREPAS